MATNKMKVKVKFTKEEIVDAIISRLSEQLKTRNGDFFLAIHQLLSERLSK